MQSENYIALLRGINVGGKNKVLMPQLVDAFITTGFSNVQTYINSGNILFSSTCEDTCEDSLKLQVRCKEIIQQKFGLDIPVAVLSAAEYNEAIAHAPAWWGHEPDAKHNAIFVIAPAQAKELIQSVGSKPEYEKIDHYGSIIFWSAPLVTFSRTKWSKVSSMSAYQSITIRNANTARKLLSMLRGREKQNGEEAVTARTSASNSSPVTLTPDKF